MLSNKQKEKIREVNLFRYSLHEDINDIPVTLDRAEFVIPSFIELKKAAIEQILDVGFESVEAVAPRNANCIIRVFKSLHHRHDNEFCNAYGYCCYTRSDGDWFGSSPCNDSYRINYYKHEYRLNLFQDEYIMFNTDFFDCYVKIS